MTPAFVATVRGALVLLASVAVSTAAWGGWQDDIEFTRLSDALGPNTPTGAGVFISQVEAGGNDGNTYFPDTNFIDFVAANDPFGQPVTFVNGSKAAHPNPAISNHATSVVGRQFYGNTLGLASGSNTVVVYEAGDYLFNFLNGTGPTVPDAPTFVDPADSQQKQYVVQNHSWILTSNESDDAVYLRKFDYLIDTYDVTMAVGVNNGTSSTPHPGLPNVPGHSYNAISVGRSDGLHSIENTHGFYGLDRIKPQIVSPHATASAATGSVSGAAALLHEVLAGTDGARSETMRAILLAGATKSEFLNYEDPDTGQLDPWSRAPTKPLDNIFGAGELNIYNSYLMTLGGRFPGSTGTPTSVGSHGWDFQTHGPGPVKQYSFTIPEGSTATELSIILTWNAQVSTPFMTNPTLANMSLTFRDGLAVIDSSSSAVDNVEHIYLTNLAAGTYTLNLNTDVSTEYGIAWRTETLFDDPSADFNEDGVVNGADFLRWQGGFGTLLGATHAMGDADGDGDVDEIDAAILGGSFGTSAPLLPTLAVAVPEPATVLLAAGSLLSLLLRRRRAKR